MNESRHDHKDTDKTYAPPELSEPATTSTRPNLVIFDIYRLSACVKHNSIVEPESLVVERLLEPETQRRRTLPRWSSPLLKYGFFWNTSHSRHQKTEGPSTLDVVQHIVKQCTVKYTIEVL